VVCYETNEELTSLKETMNITWVPGWSVLHGFNKALDLVTPYIFTLKPDGAVAVSEVKPDGSRPHYQMKWSAGWMESFPFLLSSDSENTYQFSYKSVDGRVDIDRLKPNLTGWDGLTTKYIDKDFDYLVSYRLSTDNFQHILFVDNNQKGKVKYYHVSQNGMDLIQDKEGNWSLGWSFSLPFRLEHDAYTYLLSHKNGTGRTDFDRITTDGAPGIFTCNNDVGFDIAVILRPISYF